MSVQTVNTRTLAREIAHALGATNARQIDSGDGTIEVWQVEGDDHQPIVIQYHESSDSLRVNHGPHTGLWFDSHAVDDISYIGWPSDAIRRAAEIIYTTLNEGDEDMYRRGEDHPHYDHEPNDLDLALLRLIKDYIAEEGRPPTIREMADRAGVASTTTITFRLKRLVRFGMIERGPYKSSRAMKIADEWKD